MYKKWNEYELAQALGRRHKRDFFSTQVMAGPHGSRRLDFLAIVKSYANPRFTAYEIKTSRSDFKNDRKWPDYLDYCHEFVFACPKGLITLQDIDHFQHKGVGLLYVNDTGTTRMVRKPVYRPIDICPTFLQSVIMSHLDNDHASSLVPSKKEELIKNWLSRKIDTYTLGRTFNSELVRRCVKAESESRRSEISLEHSRSALKELAELTGVHSYWQIRALVKTVVEAQAIVDSKKFSKVLSLLKKIQEVELFDVSE